MKADGGPAFPVFESYEPDAMRTPGIQYLGMTLRDWFAGKAREGDIELHMEQENLQRYREHGNNESGVPLYLPCTREEAKFLYADAMLEAREVEDHE